MYRNYWDPDCTTTTGLPTDPTFRVKPGYRCYWMNGPISVDDLTTADTTPPLTGKSAQVGINISVEVWNTDPTPAKVWGPLVYVVASNHVWTVPDDTVSGLLADTTYQVRITGTVNGSSEIATGELVITS